jgi:hypothetical protein
MTKERYVELMGKTSLTLDECEELMGIDSDGDLIITMNSAISELPDDLTVNGDLIINCGSIMTRLPNRLTVTGNVFVAHTSISELPVDLKVGGDLDVDSCPITHIPSTILVGGDINLSGTKLAELPDNFIANGGLCISYTPISKLPKGLVVKKWLKVSGCHQLCELPDDINVGGSIYMRRTRISKFPEHITHVQGSLDIHQTKISSLPENIHIDGDFRAGWSNLKNLSNGLCVGGSIDVSHTSVSSIPDGIRHIYGNLDIDSTNISELPSGLIVDGSLYISNSAVTQLPDDIIVGGTIAIDGANIHTLPDNLIVCDDLYIQNTNIKTLPDGLVVSGTIYVNDRNQLEISSESMIKIGGKIVYYVSDSDTLVGVVNIPSEDQKLKDGDYVEGRYLYADGILTHVKSKKTCGKYTIYYGKIKTRNVVYDGTYYAHCDNIRDGIRDIEFKHAKDRGLDEYKELTPDSVIKKDDAITMYRVITGACQQGTKMFIDNLGESIKDEYTISEIIELTNGEYGSDRFREFFTKENDC